MQLSLKHFITFIFCSLGLASVDVSASDIYDWITATVYLTPARQALVLTSGIAYETQTMFNVWKRCYSHSGHFVDGEDCYNAVRVAIVKWGIELAGLGVITDWWKRDDDIDGHRMVSIGGIDGYLIDLDATINVDLAKRDTGVLEFTLMNNTFHYEPVMNTAVKNGDANLIVLGLTDVNSSFPASILEANKNGTWSLNLLTANEHNKRDGVDGD